MSDRDEQNLDFLGAGLTQIDAVNQHFYNRFQFPPPPQQFSYLNDRHLELRMLNQSIGSWDHRRIPRKPKIWVAGCGTHQAISTALSFPTAQVFGSDLADEALADCQRIADNLRISNLVIRQESLLAADYNSEFDYIVCTGVLHHLADPAMGLRALARALKPHGILELMVYNRFHRIVSSAYQKAIRMLSCGGLTNEPDFGLELARKLVAECPMQGQFGEYVDRKGSESLFADTFLQPVEQSYTVDSLDALADDCGLVLLCPQTTLWDKRWNKGPWNMEFQDQQLRRCYLRLDDTQRWRITNLLRLEDSPLLWFYLQRQDSGRLRKSEKQLCEEFLKLNFRSNDTQQRRFYVDESGVFKLSPESVPYPPKPTNPVSSQILRMANGKTPMSEIFARLAIEIGFETINKLRIELTTPTFPYLTAVTDRQPRAPDPSTREKKKQVQKKLKGLARKATITHYS